MVFSSYQFIFLFLPATYVCFVIAHRLGGWPAAIRLLAAASLAFYAMLGVLLFAVLMGSLLFNYTLGHLIARRSDQPKLARSMMLAGIAANIGLLGYLKYTNFLIDVVNQVSGTGFNHLALLVPVGVSFFTFIQIGYLIDAYNGQMIRSNFSRYIIFGAFFPCVTAGPLVMHREIMEQLDSRTGGAFNIRNLVTGLTMFGMGLFKKVALADSISPYANRVFDSVATGGAADALTAWIGATCYALQLYFDFSGYSDMALGIAFIFGIRLPLNFDSPFKAGNISDFWRRWHMTMTRFFTSYIYSGLAMNGMRSAMVNGSGKLEKFIRAAALPSIITFVVAGVWHGAGWNMVVYGLMHGVAIAVCLGWREFSTVKLPHAAGWVLTMCMVLSALVVFRAPDLTTAGTLLANMWGVASFTVAQAASPVSELDIGRAVSMIVLQGAIVLLLPNTQQILHKDWISSDEKPEKAAVEAGLLTWRPALTGAVVIAAAYTVSLTAMGSGSTFLYYQF
jgi:alginate O-acetyltransferase complex protein AlgI